MGLQGDLTKRVAPGVGPMQLTLNLTFTEIRLMALVYVKSLANAPIAPTFHMGVIGDLPLRGAPI